MAEQAVVEWADSSVSGARDGVRQRTEVVLGRAEFLEYADAALLRQVLDAGVKPKEVAAVAGVSERTIQRRVRKLVERLTDEAVVYVLRHHRTWPRVTRKVALGRWVKGWTLAEACERLGLTLHELRRECDRISGRLTAAGVIHELGKSRRRCG